MGRRKGTKGLYSLKIDDGICELRLESKLACSNCKFYKIACKGGRSLPLDKRKRKATQIIAEEKKEEQELPKPLSRNLSKKEIEIFRDMNYSAADASKLTGRPKNTIWSWRKRNKEFLKLPN